MRWEQVAGVPAQGLFGLVKERKSGNEVGKLTSDHLRGEKLWRVKPMGVGG